MHRDQLTDATAREVFAALREARQIAPFSTSETALSVSDAYRVTAGLRTLRLASGDKHAGRKIGFTNRTIWDEYGVHAPIWGDMYDSTIFRTDGNGKGTLALNGLCEPRIEPEIVFGLAAPVSADMDYKAILSRLAWIAHGFEVVHSIYPGWKFTIADTVACGGLHGRLIVGPRQPVSGFAAPALISELATFTLQLHRGGALIDSGTGANVLDSPLRALRHLAGVLESDSHNPPLKEGEIVTTGTLTRAFSVAPGESWTTRLHGIDLPGLEVDFV